MGQDFVKKIGPFGCVFFILIFILFLVWCFKPATSELSGYTAPHDTAYYSQNDQTLTELQAELQDNVFIKLQGVESSTVENGKLTVVIQGDYFADTRDEILKYYDESLFNFERS